VLGQRKLQLSAALLPEGGFVFVWAQAELVGPVLFFFLADYFQLFLTLGLADEQICDLMESWHCQYVENLVFIPKDVGNHIVRAGSCSAFSCCKFTLLIGRRVCAFVELYCC
jgi:hypothetical protein